MNPPLLDAAVSQTILHRVAIFLFIYFLRVSYLLDRFLFYGVTTSGIW